MKAVVKSIITLGIVAGVLYFVFRKPKEKKL